MEEIIILVCSLLLGAVVLVIMFWFCSVMVNRANYKYYRSTAKALLSGDYVYNKYFSEYSDIIYYRKPGDDSPSSKDEILFFSDGPIKLLGRSAYIHDAAYTYFDPYTNYWRRKILRIFNDLETKRIAQLKQS